IQNRLPTELSDPGGRHDLEPDGLPDTRRPRIPDRMRLRLPILFAARLREVLRVVVCQHDDFLLAVGRQKRRDVEREARVSAPMIADQVSIDPDGRGVVDGAAVQQYAVAWRQIGPREVAPIPAGSEKPALRDAAAAGLRGKWHANRA